MENEFEQMLEESFKTIRTKEVVKGTVIAVKENELVVNVGAKSDGIIKIDDRNRAQLAEVKAGDEIEARVATLNDGEGQMVLTVNRPRQEMKSQVLEDACNNKTVLTETVTEAVKAGLSVTVDGIKVFIPASLVSDTFERDLTKYEGQEISFQITEYDPKKRRVIGDRKSLIVAEKEAALKAVLESINVGDVVEGTVKNITDFGAFIDLGGADGLLHTSEMAWGRHASPKKTFKQGDVVRAFIKSIDGTKIALSKKFPDEDPWANADVKYAVGNVVTGKVARLTEWGAFISIDENVDGLLHVSQIKYERIETPSEVLAVGDEITAKVLELDLEKHKISLSMKALLPKPERPRKPRKAQTADKITTDDENGMVNVEAYIQKMDAEEAAKAAKEAEEAAKAAEAETEE